MKETDTGDSDTTLLKKRLWRRCFPLNLEKFLRTPFLQNTSGRLLLHRETKIAFRLKALFFLKNIFCLYFSPIAKLWPRKKVIFKVFVFWKYSKTLTFKSSHQRCSMKKVFLEISQNSQENTCARASFLIKLQAYNFIKKETLTQVFSCEFCKIFKNTYFTEHLWTTASKVFSLSKNINTLILFIVSWKNQFAQDISMLILAVLPSLVCLIGLPKCDLHKYVNSFKARS